MGEDLKYFLECGFSSPEVEVGLHNDNEIKAFLTQDLHYRCENGEVITIPKGFKTDFASVPKAFQSIINFWGLHGLPAILHDYLYSQECDLKDITRHKADSIFYHAMLRFGMSRIKAYTMYCALRGFGKSHFRSSKNGNK